MKRLLVMISQISKKLRKTVAHRAFFLCEYCKSPRNYSPSPFDVEHIIPISRGGKSESSNLAYSCNGCNGNKSNKIIAIDPVTNLPAPIFHPRQQEWTTHFTWDETGSIIIGITPIGRASVVLLKLNRVELLNLRSILVIVGKHPPDMTH